MISLMTLDFLCSWNTVNIAVVDEEDSGGIWTVGIVFLIEQKLNLI